MTLCFLGKISEEPGQHIFLPPVILRNEVTKNPVVGKPGSQNSFPCADRQRQRPLCRQNSCPRTSVQGQPTLFRK